MGSGNLAFAKDPLFFIPSGMQVFGSKPWFCMKKTIRFGVVLPVGAAKSRSGESEPPKAAPVPAAIPCNNLLRLSMADLTTRFAIGCFVVAEQTFPSIQIFNPPQYPWKTFHGRPSMAAPVHDDKHAATAREADCVIWSVDS